MANLQVGSLKRNCCYIPGRINNFNTTRIFQTSSAHVPRTELYIQWVPIFRIDAAISPVSSTPILLEKNYTFCGAMKQIRSRPSYILGFQFLQNSAHTHTRARAPVGTRWTSNQLVTVAATYTTHFKLNRRISMLRVELESAYPRINRSQTNSLDGTATGIDLWTNSPPPTTILWCRFG